MEPRTRILLLAAGLALVLLSLAPRLAALRLPGNDRGYAPEQPIAFSHRLHAGELRMDCLYCHFGAEQSRHAGIPSASLCMNCHRFVSAPFGEVMAENKRAADEKRKPNRVVSPEIRKLYTALGLDGRGEPDPAGQKTPIQWTRVHLLPDFAYFDHRAHLTAGLSCQKCHGPVESMERVRQESDLSMGWCVNCHRDSNVTGVQGHEVHAPLNCSACHY